MHYKTKKCKEGKHDECKSCLCACEHHDKEAEPLEQNPYGFGESIDEVAE